jgi:hypothetical protein
MKAEQETAMTRRITLALATLSLLAAAPCAAQDKPAGPVQSDSAEAGGGAGGLGRATTPKTPLKPKPKHTKDDSAGRASSAEVNAEKAQAGGGGR